MSKNTTDTHNTYNGTVVNVNEMNVHIDKLVIADERADESSMTKQTYKVLDVTYHCHTEPDGSSVMEVRYRIGRDRTISEYLNFETPFDCFHASSWWQERSADPVPRTNQHAVDSANYHAVAHTVEIEIEYYHFGCRFERYTLCAKPPGKDELW